VYYFKFTIPKQDGDKTVSYSPGWHGTMPHCPKDVTVLIYNDKEGFGIAQTPDIFIPPEVVVITSKEAEDELKLCKNKDDAIKKDPKYKDDLAMDGKPKEIWYGDKLLKKWDEIDVTPIKGVNNGR